MQLTKTSTQTRALLQRISDLKSNIGEDQCLYGLQ